MKVTTRYIDTEVYESVNENGNKVGIDMRASEIKENQSPTELLLSALAACVAVDVVIILEKKRRTVNDLVIETNGQRRDEHPRGFINIDMHFILYSPDTPEEEMLKVTTMALEKYCSVGSTLKPPINITVEVKNE